MTASNATQCPSESMLSDFALGKLDAADAGTISEHLETCADCRQRVAKLRHDGVVNRLPERAAPDHGRPALDGGNPARHVSDSSETRSASESQRGEMPIPTISFVEQARPTGVRIPSSVPPALANHPDYEIIKELGRGGMGVVYLARNRIMDRLEVLKVVNHALLDKPDALERFQQEIRSAARLSHANIVAAYSVLRPGDLLVFAMEYVPGQDLSQVVKKRGGLPIGNAAFYAYQVAIGLQHAHEKGMVHRDIKPNNLMLAVEGKKHVVKILDFGLAKATSEKLAETALTRTGQMLGTPAYVAPEQTLDAHQADIRADIYSLGCTLYYLLAGRPPFQHESLYGLLDAHQKIEPQPVNALRPEVPVELAAIVSRMLAKEPAKRYQTPSEVARALLPFFRPGQSSSAPPSDSGKVQSTAEADSEPSGLAAIGPITPAPLAYPIPKASPLMVPTAVPLSATTPASHFSVSINAETPAAPPRRWSSLPPWQVMFVVVSAAAAVVILLGAVFLKEDREPAVENGETVPVAGTVESASMAVTQGEEVNDQGTVASDPGDLPDGDKSTADVFDASDPTNWIAMRSLGANENIHEPTVSGWRFDGGEIVSATKLPGWLKTKRPFADFELELEFKMLSKTKSGIFIRTPDRGPLSTSGIEIQLLASDTARKRIAPERQTGALYDIAGPGQPVSHPIGQWNALFVRCQGERIEVALNGTKIIDADETKYPALKIRPRNGFIGLSNSHGQAAGVAFRNIRIRELTAPAEPDPMVFDGSKPANWMPMRSLGPKEDMHEPTQFGWEFRGGEIVCVTKLPGWLKSTRQFADFELELEFNMPSKTNSDIFIRTPASGQLSASGIGVQLLAADYVDPLAPEKQTGALWGIAGPSQAVQRPIGQWNSLFVRCQGERIEVSLNGTKIIDANETQYPELKKRPRRGFVGISNWHGQAMGAAFRNIRIRELAATDGSKPVK